jgi:hypothetical protein
MVVCALLVSLLVITTGLLARVFLTVWIILASVNAPGPDLAAASAEAP